LASFEEYRETDASAVRLLHEARRGGNPAAESLAQERTSGRTNARGG
jgi:hypothetical protein